MPLPVATKLHILISSKRYGRTTMFSDLQANLISAFLECALFGIFFVASTASLILLLKRHRARNHRVSEVVTISTSVFRWRKWAAAAWSLRHSPLILATVLFMGTICAV